MTRRPTFWLTFSALGLAGVVAAVTLFSVALPSISVDIVMDRAAAMDSASSLAARYSWGSSEDRSAATFGLADPIVQTYVELEGGGSEVVERLAERNVYEAYQWRVRRFAEARVEESWTSFTPAGEPYGFQVRLAEDDLAEGNRSPEDARGVAEAVATAWGVALEAYALVESSAETLPAGRVDHTFVYERSDERLAEASFRLRLVVAGSRVTGLTHFVRVPEAFGRQYADMRSTNDTIALVAQAVLLIVFGLLGAGVGSALLLRERWLEWRAPLAWGAIISGLLGAATVNQLPLTWSGYDTALSATSFVVQQVAGGAAIALLGAPLIAFFLLAGESLGRRAFPAHVQQWRFWSPEVASSRTALGMTAAAYLMVGLQVGYVVLFYLGTQRLEGWWSPADALVQPDLLATYLPWLEAVSLSLFAAFWEESLFRAAPIACAALLGARFGRKGLWVWTAVVLQAVVFAAGHANYPQQPPYARVIELTAPALLWGAVYVGYGLVPTIMAHFLYDLSLISIVLFESRALVDQTVIVMVGLVPLGVVLFAMRRHGARSRPPEWAYNRAWVPPTRADRDTTTDVGATPSVDPFGVAEVTARRPGLPGWAIGLGVTVGAVAVASVARIDPPPSLAGDRSSAIEAASAALVARGVPVEEWDFFVATASGATEGREYVFAEAPESFEELEGRYFGAPRWIVRLVDWDAEAAERVEEYRAYVTPDGFVERVSHTLPEARPGASLNVQAARVLAVQAVTRRYGLEPGDLREVEAQETRRPNRTDWLFTFTERGRLQEVEGELRLQAGIAGDEVTDVVSTVYLPEEWRRERRRLQSRTQIMAGGFSLLLVILFGGATVTAVVVWSRRGLPTQPLIAISGVALVTLVASSANDWPMTTASFVTGQPWAFQANATLLGLALVASIAAPAIGLVGALGHAWLEPARPYRPGPALVVASGSCFGGLAVWAQFMAPGPRTAGYSGAAAAVPMLSPVAGIAPAFLLLTSAALAAVALRRKYRGHPVVESTLWSLVLGAAAVLTPPEVQASLPLWGATALLAAAVLGAGFHLCTRVPALVPALVASVLGMNTLADTWWEPYAGARAGGVIAALLVAGLAWFWTRELTVVRAPASADQSLVGTRASVGSE